MFCNLNAEMARKGMTGACLAEKLGITSDHAFVKAKR